MNIERISVLCAFAGVLLVAGRAPAQDQTQKQLALFENERIEVVRLSHIDPHRLADAINKMDLPVRVAPASEDKLLLRGPKEAVSLILDSVVKVLDVPASSDESVLTTVLSLPPSVASAGNPVPLIEAAVAGSPRTRIAYDPRAQTLVVRAPQRELETIQAVLVRLAKPKRALSMECFFIRAKLNGSKDQGGQGLPARLADVGKALAENGLGELELLTPMIVATREGEHFESSATFNDAAVREGGSAGEMSFLVQGNARLDEGGKLADLSIDARVHGVYRTADESEGRTGFELTTSVATPVGDYAVLAASPSSTAGGDVIALAVRVMAK